MGGCEFEDEKKRNFRISAIGTMDNSCCGQLGQTHIKRTSYAKRLEITDGRRT